MSKYTSPSSLEKLEGLATWCLHFHRAMQLGPSQPWGRNTVGVQALSSSPQSSQRPLSWPLFRSLRPL